jgi:hypothetical protein
MAIIRQSYQTNVGAIAYIRRSTDVDATDPSTNPTADPVDPNFYVSSSKSRRKQGLTARFVTIGTVIATAASGSVLYKKARITCTTTAGFNTLAATPGATISYKGVTTYRVLGATPEG